MAPTLTAETEKLLCQQSRWKAIKQHNNTSNTYDPQNEKTHAYVSLSLPLSDTHSRKKTLT